MGRGFTLVELLVILVILAITAAATAPTLASIIQEDPGTAASRELVNILSGARRSAARRGTTVSVIVDPGSARYWVLTDRGTSSESVRTAVIPVAPPTKLIASTERVSFVFDPEGPAHADSIVVQTEAGGVVVGVDRWTGVPYVR